MYSELTKIVSTRISGTRLLLLRRHSNRNHHFSVGKRARQRPLLHYSYFSTTCSSTSDDVSFGRTQKLASSPPERIPSSLVCNHGHYDWYNNNNNNNNRYFYSSTSERSGRMIAESTIRSSSRGFHSIRPGSTVLSSQAAAAAAGSQYVSSFEDEDDDDNEEHNDDYGEDVQATPLSSATNGTSTNGEGDHNRRLPNSSSSPPLLPPSSTAHTTTSSRTGNDFTRRQRQQSTAAPNALDLELGEVWDQHNRMDPWYQEEGEDDDGYYGYNDDEYGQNKKRRTTSLNKGGFATTISGDDSSSIRRSAVELLMHFDPQNPPVSDDPDDLQLWLECEAQQEAVLKYQKVLESARERKDYSSLSLVQQQVVRWFPKLQETIAARQKQYILKEKSKEVVETDTAGGEGKSNNNTKSKNKNNNNVSLGRYGPFLCVLPPAKLAVICAHEAIMHSLMKSGLQGSADGVVTFVSMAKRIGEAVEDEVLIHRVLHQRFRAEQQMRLKNEEEEEVDDDGGGGGEEPTVVVEPSDLEKNLAELLSLANGMDENKDAAVNAADNNDNNNRNKNNNLLDPATHKWSYTSTHLQNYMDEVSKYKPSAKKRRVAAYALRRARGVLEKDEMWTTPEKIQLGAALFQALLENATVKTPDGKEEMAFTYEKRWVKNNKLKSFVQLNDKLYRMVVSDKLLSLSATTTRHKPMIRPPKPWTSIHKGGYLWINAELMRYHGCNTQEEVLRNADLTTTFDGLNALGRVPWKINRRILEVAQKCWEDNIPLGDIPSQTDYEVPPEPVQPDTGSFAGMDKNSPEYKQMIEANRGYRDALYKYNRIRQRNMDLRSLRCSAMLKLDQAEKFKEFGSIYFPYNMDFRGRAYPVPAHLSNVGSDLCRGVLMFSESKPLGPRGLYWLKVHLANLAGKDKMSFDDRAAFVDENMESVRESVGDPFAGDRWWMKLEDPFQGLATCMEIINAIDSGDPGSYQCSLPVHMDGSCNGLQHYAALGRDVVGGTAVNLCATDEPQDVYVGVMDEVIRRVAEEAERRLDFNEHDFDSLNKEEKKALAANRGAKLVNGLIDRGVVKRTVMTSVYGVTYIGARHQIQEKIESKLENQGVDIDEESHEIFMASGYLARVTMDVMGDLFTGAKETMNWLTACARLITQHGYPVAWISPIGLPAIQPYRQKKPATIVTLLQTVTVTDESDDLPLHKKRQVSAFPPNYVHSLDSSHMLLTALEMDRRGLTFSAVHDSFWTHACDIDEMNACLRDVFVELYDQPLLETLKETWEMRYPDIEFPDLPERGDLDLNEVKKAKYFFQ